VYRATATPGRGGFDFEAGRALTDSTSWAVENAIRLPSGDQAGARMPTIPNVTCVAADTLDPS